MKLKGVWGAWIGLAAVMLAVFFPLLDPARILFTTDDSIGSLVVYARAMPFALGGGWDDLVLLGGGYQGRLSWTGLMEWWWPLSLFVNFYRGLSLMLGAGLLVLWLRARGVRTLAAVLGSLAAFWLASNLTLIYPGHILKFSTLMFGAAFLLLSGLDKPGSRWGVSLLSGGMLAGMFLEQQDLALFMMVVLGPYWLFRCWSAYGMSGMGKPLMRAAVGMGAVFALLALAPIFGIYQANTSGIVGQDQSAPEERWLFATQWSVPPNETIDLIAPNYFGIRSGEAEGPYWGATGRSPGWEQTHKGFMNFKLESIYIGAIPVALALFAVAAALFGRKGGRWKVEGGGQRSEVRGQKPEVRGQKPEVRGQKPEVREQKSEGRSQRSEVSGQMGEVMSAASSTYHLPPPTLPPDRRAEILFWGAAALVTLLLAYGKYFPLYALFYKLPVVNNIRNPNKFLQVFQLCLGILAAYGLDTAMRMKRTVD